MSVCASAVVIGASSGGIEALSTIIRALPRDFPLPVLVVVHLPPDRESLLPEILERQGALPVQEAEDKAAIAPGTIYLAPPDYHLLVEASGQLSLASDEPVLFSRPSIDVLFESAADAYRENLIGIVLTGANEDGAAGLRAVAAAGGCALVQDPASAAVRTMPEAALAAVPQARVMTTAQIGLFLSGEVKPCP